MNGGPMNAAEIYAAEIYAAELEPRDITIGRRAGMLAGSAASIALSLFGMGDSPIEIGRAHV